MKIVFSPLRVKGCAAGWVYRCGAKYTVNWGVQIVGMNFRHVFV
ncbi:DUF6783 domain-containing protein [Blautia pseudococcoides]